MISSPSKRAPPTGGNTGYIHSFGYHFAKKMLGASHVDECIRQAHWLQQQQDSSEDSFHCFRANWRSNNVRYPWQLPKISARASGDEISRPETLFVDVTFDFLLFPIEIVDEGRTQCCHVLKMEDFGKELKEEEYDSIAISVAIRIGALIGVPSSASQTGEDEAVDRGDGYRYFYQRGGNDALTIWDLDEHCSSIDIVREEMDPADVARIMGDAFLDGCNNGSKVWQVMTTSENGTNTTGSSTDLNTEIINNEMGDAETTKRKNFDWHLKVHHQKLEADGLLPLSNNSGCMGEPIGRCILDMILLQSNTSREGCACVSVPKAEALLLWREINPAIVKALERPVEPSPKKMSPVRKCLAASVVPSPIRKAINKEESNDDKSNEPKTSKRRPPSKPQETGLFARGKRTTLGGSRRKKPKFTLGPS